MTDADGTPHAPVGIQRRISQSSASFGSQVPNTTGLSYASRQVEAGEEVIMLLPRTEAAALRIIHTSAVKCNIADTPHQSAAFYLSVLVGLFPGLLPLAKEVLQETGFAVREVTEDTAFEYRITLQGWIDVSTCHAIFGQFAMVIYKNIDDRSYVQRSAAAIKKLAGVVGDLVPGEGDILLSISTAKNIRTIVGSNSKIRAELLKIILANRDGESRFNCVCNYLAEVISWTEMSQVKSVIDTFCLTDSPVLKDSRVKHEVKNLYEAHERINEKQYPQYYGILHPDEARVIIGRSRFETLAEVARLYKSEQINTVSQFPVSSNSQNTLVSKLLSVHRADMARNHVDDDTAEAIRFLTTFDTDEAIRFATTFDTDALGVEQGRD